MGAEVTINVGMTIVEGKTSTIRIRVAGQEEFVEVPIEIKAYFDEQFSRPHPTHNQKKRYKTMMKLLECAFIAGSQSKK
jgi:hypothetical protein